MGKHFLSLLLAVGLCLFNGGYFLCAQEVNENIENANTYLEHRMSALEKSADINGKLQQKLLKRLQRKEDKMLRKMAKQDSALYKQYVSQHLNYNSIAAISNDSTKHPNISGGSKAIDSLKAIQSYIKNQTAKLQASSGSITQIGITVPGDENLNAIQQKLNTQFSTDQLIQQHTNDLKKLAGGANISGLQSIQKDVFYTKEKMKAYSEMADDPDAAEAKALEYLQGSEGFDKYLNPGNGSAFGGLGNEATEADLHRMGYQTKTQLNSLLQQKLGGSTDQIQQQMGQQISQYSDKINKLKSEADKAKNEIAQAKQTASDVTTETANAKKNFKDIEKPDFKINKEKGKPFWKRIETQYNFTTSRSSVDGLRPAMINIGASAGYKQTEKLSFGIGFALNTGLGQNWQHLKITYEGVSIRSYADWLWVYGFSFQAGYERAFIPSNRPYLASTSDQTNNNNNNNNNPNTVVTDNALKTAFGGQSQTGYVGVMKRYRIGKQWNGTFLIGYNLLWQSAEISRSPWLIRIGWSK